jgi:hypothetical protein
VPAPSRERASTPPRARRTSRGNLLSPSTNTLILLYSTAVNSRPTHPAPAAHTRHPTHFADPPALPARTGACPVPPSTMLALARARPPPAMRRGTACSPPTRAGTPAHTAGGRWSARGARRRPPFLHLPQFATRSGDKAPLPLVSNCTCHVGARACACLSGPHQAPSAVDCVGTHCPMPPWRAPCLARRLAQRYLPPLSRPAPRGGDIALLCCALPVPRHAAIFWGATPPQCRALPIPPSSSSGERHPCALCHPLLPCGSVAPWRSTPRGALARRERASDGEGGEATPGGMEGRRQPPLQAAPPQPQPQPLPAAAAAAAAAARSCCSTVTPLVLRGRPGPGGVMRARWPCDC